MQSDELILLPYLLVDWLACSPQLLGQAEGSCWWIG